MPDAVQRPGRRVRKRSRTKRPNKKAVNLLADLGWIALAAAIGLPVLAGLLYLVR